MRIEIEHLAARPHRESKSGDDRRGGNPAAAGGSSHHVAVNVRGAGVSGVVVEGRRWRIENRGSRVIKAIFEAGFRTYNLRSSILDPRSSILNSSAARRIFRVALGSVA